MRTDTVFKALADPTRRRILQLLGDGEMTAGELAARFAISAPSMSHHFSVLKQADLVEARRAGQQIHYSLNTTVFQEVLGAVLELLPHADDTAQNEGPATKAERIAEWKTSKQT